MSDSGTAHVTSVDLRMKSAATSYQINQHLQGGVYRLYIVAPFETKVQVVPLNPPLGFQFQPDADAASEIWNSLIVVPQEGQYTFLVMVDRPIDSGMLYVQFLYQSPQPQPPQPQPPAPPVQPPAPPPQAPPGDMQEYYRQQGYVVGGSGAVEFFYVAFRTNKRTGQIEICLNKNLAWSNTLHDPARMMLTWPAQDATYTYGRLGPMPNRAVAEASAVQYATRLFGDPTRYGFWIVSGGIKQPSFS